MKKWILFLSSYLCLCLLAACAAAGSGSPVSGGTPTGTNTVDPAYVNTTHAESAQPTAVTMTCRIIDSAEDHNLLLAKLDGDSYSVYRLDTQDIDVVYKDAQETALLAGTLVEVTFGGDILETFPAQFGNVSGLTVLSSGFDDRCALYLQVLNDLWDVDAGLNSGIAQLGVDLSATSLSASEQAAVTQAFGNAHGISAVQGTYEELAEQGYITGEPLGGDAPEDAKFWQWENGCLFSITEKPMEGIYSLCPVTFDAQKWRSSLGAYCFCDCTSLQSASGNWSAYQVGSVAIS